MLMCSVYKLWHEQSSIRSTWHAGVISWTAWPDLFRLARLSGIGSRVKLGRNLGLGHFLSQLGCLLMIAIGDSLVQPVHDAGWLLWTTWRGWNALKTLVLDFKTFWQEHRSQKYIYCPKGKCLHTPWKINIELNHNIADNRFLNIP